MIAVGVSAGGVEPLRALVAGLPPDLPASVSLPCTCPPDAPSALPSILNRSGPLPIAEGELLRPGRSYVAPIDHHLRWRRNVN